MGNCRVFCFLKKIFGYKQDAPAVCEEKEVPLWELDYDAIWKLEDKVDFFCALSGYLSRKLDRVSDDISKLSTEERTVFIVLQTEAEVNNGGFSQFFFNSSGNFSGELEQSFRAVGAPAMAEICRNAIDALGAPVPVDWTERQLWLDDWMTDEIDTALGECDCAFYEYPDNLVELTYQYIMNHRDRFTP